MNRGTLLAVAAALLAVPTFAAERQLDFRGQKVTVNGLAEGDWEYVNGAPNSGTEELIFGFKTCEAIAIRPTHGLCN